MNSTRYSRLGVVVGLLVAGALVISGTAVADTQAPTAQGNFRVTNVTYDSASVAWDAATDNTGVVKYEVYRGDANYSNEKLVGTVLATSPRTFTDTGLSSAMYYTHAVKAVDAAGNRSDWSNATKTRTSSAPAAEIQNRPARPAALMYYNPIGPWESYAQPGTLVVAGRGNYADQPFKRISAAGGSVLIYIDPILGFNGTPQPGWDRYGKLLKDASEFGPAVPNWPNMPQASEHGWLLDFRPYVGNVLHDKLPKILDLMARENPHMAGWFLDDVGSRSWYPGIDWNSVSTADKQAYRDGAIKITQTARQIADEYKLMTIVNGTWSAGGLSAGGGYPDANQYGNAVVDGGFIENHNLDAFWTNYASSPQWASQSPLTQGKSIMVASTNDDCPAMRQYAHANLIAYGMCQSNYGQAKEPPLDPSANGLPSRATYR